MGTIHAHGTEDCGAYGEPREPEAEMFKQLPAAQSGAGVAADQGLSLPAEEEILAGVPPHEPIVERPDEDCESDAGPSAAPGDPSFARGPAEALVLGSPS
ncbi:unnamed protein product [Lepidochelys olivacea]